MTGPRRILPVSAWSAQDREALRRATTRGLRRERAGRAARWRPPTVKIMIDAVGSFLAFLGPSSTDVAEAGLAILCTEDRVLAWLMAMQERHHAAHTITFRVTGLQRGCEVMYPFTDWRWLREIVADLPDGNQESRLRRMAKVRHSRELLELGVRLITNSLTDRFLRPHLRYVQARDGMMIAFLSLRPLRVGNLFKLQLGVHLTRQEDGRWRIHIADGETKNSETIDMILPKDIALLLERHLKVDRPALLSRRPLGTDEADYLWISEDGLPLTYAGVRTRITEQTLEAFGVAISPHRFRDASASTIAMEMPAEMDMALPLLGNRDPKTIEAHYNMATTLQAAQKLSQSLTALMHELGVRTALK
jgi:integrase/recombinase XerD